ncbi:hypothetical protein [Fibrella aquatica]|uniref:hypothetical protein n=1 Tax=Fibrella aquatica TaxID=3242487 RepID=UPI0035219BEB
MATQSHTASSDTNEPDNSLVIDENTTLDVFIGPNNSITELADTHDSMDGVQAETIDITNEKDGTHVEIISLEEPSADDPRMDVVDNFITVEGIGPEVAALLIAGGVRTFKQLANTPVDQIRAILAAAGLQFRIHDATEWPERARNMHPLPPSRRAINE